MKKTTTHLLILLALTACGDSGPPPASLADGGGGLQCVDEENAFLVPCPEGEELCWSRRYDLPKECADGETPVDLGTSSSDAGPLLADASSGRDAGVSQPDAAAQPDLGTDLGPPSVFDPRLETWPTAEDPCEKPGIGVGSCACAFGAEDVWEGVCRPPASSCLLPGGAFDPACGLQGDACTQNAPTGPDACQPYLTCFEGTCTDVCADDLECVRKYGTGATCLDVGHELFGVCQR